MGRGRVLFVTAPTAFNAGKLPDWAETILRGVLPDATATSG